MRQHVRRQKEGSKQHTLATADLERIARLKSRLQYAELKIRVLEERLRLMRIEKHGEHLPYDGARLPVCRAGLGQVTAGPVRASRGRDLKRARCETVGQFFPFDIPGLLQQLPVAYELFFGDRRCGFST
jgi:hypothetical protein